MATKKGVKKAGHVFQCKDCYRVQAEAGPCKFCFPVVATISPWMPEQDRIRLATLLKLIEEAGELISRSARSLAQGLDETDPDSKRTNREELRREISDVAACLHMLDAVEGISLDQTRKEAKISGFRRWHEMIKGVFKNVRA